MYKFIKTETLEGIELFEAQGESVLTESDTNIVLQRDNIRGYYIYKDLEKIGFILVRENSERDHFLWSYIIDNKFQNLGHGTVALKAFIQTLKEQSSVKRISLCCELGNDTALRIYDKVGFCELGRRDFEGDDGKNHREVSMAIYL